MSDRFGEPEWPERSSPDDRALAPSYGHVQRVLVRDGLVGALALGAFASGAVAIGRLVVRTLRLGRGEIRSLKIADLEVGHLRVGRITRPDSSAEEPRR